MHRWQPAIRKASAASCKRDRNSRDDRPELHLTLDSADHQVAAEAVIATLYSAREPIQDLTLEELVQAVILSDRLQLADAAQQALTALMQKISSVRSLPQESITLFSNLAVWPRSLLPALLAIVKAWPQRLTDPNSGSGPDRYGLQDAEALQRMLLAVFGKLNEVWADTQLHELLMELPLKAVQLLLSADGLVVDSEDTVLYTAAQYIKKQNNHAYGAAGRALADVIRCPWLSTCCLQAAVLAAATYGDTGSGSDSANVDEPGCQLLHQHKQKLTELFSLRLLSQANITSRVRQNIPTAPPSWWLPARPHQEVPTVSVTWTLDIEELRAACHQCWLSNEQQHLKGPTTPPKAGVGWQATLDCDVGLDSRRTMTIGLSAGPIDVPQHIFYGYHFTIDIWSSEGDDSSRRTHRKTRHVTAKDVAGHEMFWGWKDFFGVGEMPSEAEGLDMSAWVEAGWPDSGQLDIELVVRDVDGQDPPSPST